MDEVTRRGARVYAALFQRLIQIMREDCCEGVTTPLMVFQHRINIKIRQQETVPPSFACELTGVDPSDEIQPVFREELGAHGYQVEGMAKIEGGWQFTLIEVASR